jgi:1-carboxybiuret hydrolase subunit AtzG-like protein
MDELRILAYVKASAALLELPLDEARARRVAAHLARTARMARLLESVALAVEDEPAEVYRPAPFPSGETPR